MKQGIFCPISGKIGTLVGTAWNGAAYSKKVPSKEQLAQRMKFGLVTGFLIRISHLINPGFAATAGFISLMNEAADYHLRNALKGISPNFSLDWAN